MNSISVDGVIFKINDKIKINKMLNEGQYTGKQGIIEFIDDYGQLHGTWGGCALIPNVDRFEKVETALDRHDKEIKNTIFRIQRAVDDDCWKMVYDLERYLHQLIKDRKLYVKLHNKQI